MPIRLAVRTLFAGITLWMTTGVLGQHTDLDAFKRSISSFDYAEALVYIQSDTTKAAAKHLLNQLDEIVAEVKDRSTSECASALEHALLGKALVDCATPGNRSASAQQELAAHLAALVQTARWDCLAANQEAILDLLNSKPPYTGILALEYITLFPLLPQELVYSFLEQSRWVGPLVNKHTRLNGAGGLPNANFLLVEATSITAVMYHAMSLRQERPNAAPDIPSVAEYFTVTKEMARAARESRNKDIIAVSSVFALPYVLLLSDAEVCKSLVSEEDQGMHLAALNGTLDHCLTTKWKGGFEWMSTVIGLYCRAFANTYVLPYSAENARGAHLVSAELIAKHAQALRVNLGVCTFAQIAANADAAVLLYNMQTTEVTPQFLSFYQTIDTVYVACGKALDVDTLHATWSPFQVVFGTLCALSKYETVCELMALAADQLRNHAEVNRSSWMDFLAVEFMNNFRHDTLSNDVLSASYMNRFVTLYLETGDSRTEPIPANVAQLLLHHLAVAEHLAAMPTEARCTAVSHIRKLLAKQGCPEYLTHFAAMLQAECNKDERTTSKHANAVIELPTTAANAEMQLFCFSVIWAYSEIPLSHEFFDEYIQRNISYYGSCSSHVPLSISQAILALLRYHSPLETANFLAECFKNYYDPACQQKIDWLAPFLSVSRALWNEPEQQRVFHRDMEHHFGDLRVSDCTTLDQTESFADWKIAYYEDFSDAERRAREALKALATIHPQGEQAFISTRPAHIQQRYYSIKLTAFTTLCSAFQDPTNPRPDSLCHYAGLMAEILVLQPALARDFEEHVRDRQEQCRALSSSQVASNHWTHLLSKAELEALSDASFSDYVSWFIQEMTDSVQVLRSKYEYLDRDELVKRIHAIDDTFSDLQGHARQRRITLDFIQLAKSRASLALNSYELENRVAEIVSLNMRYKLLTAGGYNTAANLSSNPRRKAIYRDIYTSTAALNTRVASLTAHGNILFDALQYPTAPPAQYRILVAEALDTLRRIMVSNEPETAAWIYLAKVSAQLALQSGALVEIPALAVQMEAMAKSATAAQVLQPGSVTEQEYRLLIAILRSASPGKKPPSMLLQELTAYYNRAILDGRNASGEALMRSYADAAQLNVGFVPNSDLLIRAASNCSDRAWWSWTVKKDITLDTYTSDALETFWRLSRPILYRDPSLFSSRNVDTLIEMSVQMLFLQLKLYATNPQASIVSPGFCPTALLERIWDIYWSRPPSARHQDREFTAIYSTLRKSRRIDRIEQSFSNGGAQRSIQRYMALKGHTGRQGAINYQHNTALQGYLDYGKEMSAIRGACAIGYNDIWSYFPTTAKIAYFNRNDVSEQYQALILSPDTIVLLPLGSVNEVESSWKRWLTFMEAGNDAGAEAEVQSFWTQFSQYTSADTTWDQYIIVPDGVYFNINPQALPIEPTGRKRVDVAVDLYSYLEREIPTNVVGPVYLIGGLNYGGRGTEPFGLASLMRSDNGLEQGHWLELEWTRHEIESIEKKFQGPNVQVIKITGDSATVKALHRMAFPRLIHFATHGYVMEDETTIGSAGLVLSGANNINRSMPVGAASDAYLDVDQIRKLDLFACDVVVLSACRTARSTTGLGQGEIIQAFKEAGVGQVIASSWAVPDECTAMLMDYFYEYYIRGVSASQSLAEAQRKVAMRFPNKRDWAAFMVYE